MTLLEDAAVLEADAGKRAEMYLRLEKMHRQAWPFVVMFQEIEVLGRRKNVQGYILGPSFNDNSFAHVTK